MKLIYLIGMPGTGKSTIIKEFMSRYDDWSHHKPIDLLDSHVSDNIRILGKYEDGEVFSGTDKLSMAVSPKAIEYFTSKPKEVIIGEGDRLNNKGVFDSVDNKIIIHLTVSDEERHRRYNERGSDQSDQFVKTIKTKCNNILEEYGDRQTLFGEEKGCVIEFSHETPEDTKRIVDEMIKLCSA